MLVPAGSAVNIVTATPPACYVPEIVKPGVHVSMQMHPSQADNLIRSSGLVPRNRDGNYGSGARVTYQYPRPGFKLFCGDTVEYNITWVVQ